METAAARRDYGEEKVLFLALELSNSKWKLGSTVGVGSKARERTIDGSLDSVASNDFVLDFYSTLACDPSGDTSAWSSTVQ